MRRAYLWILMTTLWSVYLGATPLELDPALRVGRLENGVSYYIWPQEKGHEISLQIVLPVGSIHEQDNELGAAHITQRALLSGTVAHKADEIQPLLPTPGEVWNADEDSNDGREASFALFDYSTLRFQVRNPADQLGKALTVLKEFVSADQLSLESFIRVKLEYPAAYKAEEMAQSAQEAAAFLDDAAYAVRFPLQPPEVVDELDWEAVRAFHRRTYQSTPFAVVAVGCLDADAMEQLIVQTFGNLAPRSWDAVKAREPRASSGLKFIKGDQAAVILLNNEHIPAQDSTESVKADIAESLFSGLFEGRLDKATELGRLSSDVGHVQLTRSVRTSYLEVECPDERFLPVLDTVVETLQLLAQEGFSDEELSTTKKLFGRILESMTTEGWVYCQLADLCACHYLGGHILRSISETSFPMPLEAQRTLLIQTIAELSNEDFKQVAAKRCKSPRVLIVYTSDEVPDITPQVEAHIAPLRYAVP